MTTLFLETLFLPRCPLRPGRQGKETAQKKVLGPLGALSSSLSIARVKGSTLRDMLQASQPNRK